MLSSFVETIQNNGRSILVSLLLLLFVGISYYIYNSYVKPRLNPSYISNKEFLPKTEDIREQEYAEVILFYTDWCPHSTAAMDIWNQFKEKYNNVTINKYTLLFKEVDCEKEEETADQFNITGYPTIKLVKNKDEIVEFDAKPTMETLDEFIHTVLS